MGDLLQDVFGSDLGSGDERFVKDSPSKGKDKGKRAPIQLSDSEHDEEPKRHQEIPSRKPPSDEEPEPEVEADPEPERKLKRDLSDDDDEEKGLKNEDHFSSDDDEADRDRERQRKKRREKSKDRKRKKPRLDSEPGFEEVERDAQGWKVKPRNDSQSEEEERERKPEVPKTDSQKVIEENKAMRRPRRKELDPQKVEADCVHFLEKMMGARDADMKAYRSGKPALSKLSMLRDVELMCMKVTHREQLLDNMLLAIIKAWLDPIPPDRALPNVEIRTSLLKILMEMKVDSDWVERLESSQGLGRVIHFLSRTDPHTPNKRLAEKIMMKWARPVYKSNANFHDLIEELGRPEDGYRQAKKDGIAYARQQANRSINQVKTTQDKMAEFKSKVGKEREQVLASVPTPNATLYSKLPENSTAVDPKFRRTSRNNRLRTQKVNRTMARMRALNKAMNARSAKPSVNGRD